MTKIVYNNKDVKLVRHSKTEWNLTVDWEGGKKPFWVNFPFSLLKVIKESAIQNGKKQFTIKADSIKSLSSFIKEREHRIKYEEAIELLYDVGNQIQTLERFFLGIPFIEFKDIVVVNDKHYFYLNVDKILDIRNDKITIDEPYHPKPLFISPEFRNIHSLPDNISYKTSFYSLALLTVNALFDKDIDDKNKLMILDSIRDTKLYWALLRMLEPNPADRFYLII